ncbi:MAG: sulfatase-like hydrolase/transferase [Hyphomonadaceae bacterium]|nr:sulfatase-like hydrolase/transferase [Hyphomonadaceae bacterium]
MRKWSRRQVARNAAAAGIVAPFAQGCATTAAAPGGPPNILFIMADDLGYADLSCYGRTDYSTPVLDGLAADGLQLTNGYANSAVCAPTRVALATGRYQYRLTIGLGEPGIRGDHGIPPEHPTLPSQLKRLGYRTALIGKWHIGSPPHFGPLRNGYDRFYGLYGGGTDYFRHAPDNALGEGAMRANATLIDQDAPARDEGYLTDLFTDRAIQWIEGGGTEPYFLSLHFTAPHWPWEGPGDQAVSQQLTDLNHQDGGSLKVYAEMVRSLDRNIGRVLEAIERGGARNNTIVVFTSDNGGERFSDVWPFVGVKGELLEGGIRVPAIVRWPGRIARGQRCEQVITSMDWMPTLLAAAGGAPDPAYPSDGANLIAELTGAPAKPRKLFWRFKANEQRAFRDGDWKYLKIRGFEHLFNLAEDQRERADRKDHEAAIFARMKAEYDAWDATMLAYTEEAYSHDVTKGNYSDRY